jgi:hypothetical protein
VVEVELDHPPGLRFVSVLKLLRIDFARIEVLQLLDLQGAVGRVDLVGQFEELEPARAAGDEDLVLRAIAEQIQ